MEYMCSQGRTWHLLCCRTYDTQGVCLYPGLNFSFWVKAQREQIHANYTIIQKNYFPQAFEVRNPDLCLMSFTCNHLTKLEHIL